MKNVSISLTDHHAAEIAALVAAGHYASVSEVIRAALRDYLEGAPMPSAEQIERDIVEHEASMARGEPMLTLDEVRALLKADIAAENAVAAAE